MTRSFASLKNMILFTTLALLPMAAVQASAEDSARVHVPFAFMANHQYVPAGTYKVLSSDTALTLIDARTGKNQAMFLVRHESGAAMESRGMLTFRQSGRVLILTEAQFAGSCTHSKLLVQPKREREAANARSASATVQVAMR